MKTQNVPVEHIRSLWYLACEKDDRYVAGGGLDQKIHFEKVARSHSNYNVTNDLE